MKVLVTGSAGFIGSALSIRLLERGDDVVGLDNHNNYYDPDLKEARLSRHLDNPKYEHIRADIEDKELITEIFESYKFDGVINLAAQAGVRYSIENPHAYLNSNILGFGIAVLVIWSTLQVVLSMVLILRCLSLYITM